jgi:predicted glycosyltransferase/CheY-like chemotaxis protein
MKPTVLVVEDEPILARNLARSLERAGLATRVAGSFAAARAALDSDGAFADFLCVDISLGDGNGLDLARLVQQRHPHVPILVMTGQDSVSNRSLAESLNTVAFLSKPFSLAHFRELVSVLLLDPPAEGPAPAAGPRVMMYSHDSIGLGHMRRNATIANELLRIVPDASVLMVVGCPSAGLFDLGPGIDVIKLPSVTKVARDRWRATSLRIAPDELGRLRSGLILRAAEAFAPDIVLVDHEPAGVWNELEPLLAARENRGRAMRMVLGLRDILDNPERVATRWRGAGIDRFLGSAYGDVLIYGDEEIYASAYHYGLDRRAGLTHHYCGYVGSHSPNDRPGSVSTPRRVLITGGGGRDAWPMMDAALRALERIPQRRRPAATLVTGPLMDDELADDLSARAGALSVRCLRRTQDMPALLAESTLLVCMGGYNTLVEAVAHGIPTVVVPRIGPSAEQRMRAEIFSTLGLVQNASLEGDLAADLAARFLDLQGLPNRSRNPAPPIRLDGARRAAETLAGLLPQRADAGPPRPRRLQNV